MQSCCESKEEQNNECKSFFITDLPETPKDLREPLETTTMKDESLRNIEAGDDIFTLLINVVYISLGLNVFLVLVVVLLVSLLHKEKRERNENFALQNEEENPLRDQVEEVETGKNEEGNCL